MDDLSGLRVLLVEDEGGVALLIEDMLEELGCVMVASAARLGRAYEAVQSKVLDLVVLDVNVAGETSFDFARMLVARGTPFVFSTGYGVGGLPVDLQNQLVLAKPFSLSDLRRSIKAALPKCTSDQPRNGACL
ncbi:response regulator [Siccirubricoccus deserti]|uniref:Response regulator n=1 Tax=Siccirubricoccus deserti TaxID=2013562 RepID=A0A9X0UFF8_9PROT|nr:response regulator [Siccirubricoccus deserti]MBC4018924.1 response regulator [Siccirubricoccus deserti]GGC69794.1 response regulator [Siccirubricoccus deserti]